MNTIQDEKKASPEKERSYINKSIGVVTDIFKGWIG